MPSAGRIQDIERLRAIAALAVLIGHVPWLQVGLSSLLQVRVDPWTGVDLFFVISGFVVSSAFERDLARAAGPSRAGAALGTFYRKRAARILPTAYLGLALWWIGAAWLNQSGTWGPPLHGSAAAGMAASGLLLVSNYGQVFAGVTMPLFWYWSICVEEHFYLLYPAFRLIVGTRRRRVVTVLVTIAAVHVIRLLTHDPRALDVLSHLRFDQLGLGVLIGLMRQQWAEAASRAAARLRAPGWPRTAGVVSILVLLLLLGVLPVTLLVDLTSNAARVGYPLAGALAAGIVLLASADAGLLAFGRSRVGALLSMLGARSYGIYMFHVSALWIVVELRQRLFGDPGAAWLRAPELIAYALVLGGMVELNYRRIERPLIAWAARAR